ncbi:MAG: ISAs1 family transposase [Hyphomicrobiales bacterium]|nr:ISAs1 family transposase [Hyphomicrobiales bacterium]
MDLLSVEKPRVASLLQHFSAIDDFREPWRIAHPLPEVLLLAVCGTIAAGDDYDEIVDWGEAHLSFLRCFLPFDWGIPCADWLRTLMNRIDPDLFAACFMSWANELRPDGLAHIALDGKTSRRSHDRRIGKRPLHLVSAFATNERLVLGQEAVNEKANELEAIPLVLDRLAETGALAGAVVTIDAIACNPKIAAKIVDNGADYVLAVKDNQPSLHREIATFFADTSPHQVDAVTDIDKNHGRIEERRCVVSNKVDWLTGERHFPGDYRFPKLTTIAMIEAKVEKPDRCYRECRHFIASAPLAAERFADIVRNHWRIENSLHWVLDVTFKEDLSRLRKGHGAHNMAVVRHFALNLVRNVDDKRSIKRRRKRAAWDNNYLATILGVTPG